MPVFARSLRLVAAAALLAWAGCASTTDSSAQIRWRRVSDHPGERISFADARERCNQQVQAPRHGPGSQARTAGFAVQYANCMRGEGWEPTQEAPSGQ